MKYYIYKTVNLLNNKYYFGCHATDNLNDGYLGSGKILKRAIKKYGKLAFNKEVIKFCSSMDNMFKEEKDLITENIVNDKMSYNCSLGGKGGYKNISDDGKKRISKARKNKVVMQQNGIYKVIDKSLFDKNKMHGTTYGKTSARTKQGKYIIVSNNEFASNDDLVGVSKGTTVVKDATDKIQVVDVNDYRIKTGELVGITKYSKQTPESNLKRSLTLTGYIRGKQKIVKCPYCNKTGGISNMKRWHFDNCKYKQN